MTYARRRRMTAVIVLCVLVFVYLSYGLYRDHVNRHKLPPVDYSNTQNALSALEHLEVKGKAPFTGYSRDQYGFGWLLIDGCDTRNKILARDMTEVQFVPGTCEVKSGMLDEQYTGKTVQFVRGSDTSDLIQIDHMVALANAWQTGAQQLSSEKRVELANDSLNLLAVDGQANQDKGSGDAATWLPPNKPFRCRYVARQIAVKLRYGLWMTQAEHDAIKRVLYSCPDQVLPIERVP